MNLSFVIRNAVESIFLSFLAVIYSDNKIPEWKDVSILREDVYVIITKRIL